MGEIVLNVTMTISANNAKERQHWINALRSVAQYQDSHMAKAAPPLHPTTHGQTTSPISPQSSGQTISSTAASTQPSQSTTTPPKDDMTKAGRSHFKGPQSQFYHVPSYVTDELVRVRDILHNIEDEQTAMIDQLEVGRTLGYYFIHSVIHSFISSFIH